MGAPRSTPSEAQTDTLALANTIAEPKSARAENAYTVEPGTMMSGKYRVVRTLGRGGMGIVVEAFHLELQMPVAIKVLLPDFMAYAEAATRFSREARAVTKLTSEHIARVIDIDALPSGEPFIVMEYLKGQDLAARGRETIPLSVPDALDYFVQACDAIANAHENGVVHRDIKPANVFLATRPNGDTIIKVLDFGVSKILTGNASEVSLTQTTTILGSALYMSPEQMRSAKNVDHRTDIYALGACLYEMLARRPPYVANSFPELCAMVYSGPPMSVTEWSPDVPEGLAKVIEKCLAHEPEGRFATVPELAVAIAPFAQETTRERIASLLKKYASHLEMPPIARKRRSYESITEADEVSPKKVDRSPRNALALALFVLSIAAFSFVFRKNAGAFLQKLLFSPPQATSVGSPQAPSVQNAPIPSFSGSLTPSSAASPPSPMAPPSTSAAAASTAANASAVKPREATSSNPTAAPLPTNSSAASASVASAANSSTPSATASATLPEAEPYPSRPEPAKPSASAAPSVNPDLSDQVCYALYPDGTREQVPCP